MIALLIAIALVVLLGYVVIAAIAAHRMTTAHRRLPQRTPDEFGMAYQAVTFAARGDRVTIAAWYIAAPGAQRAVIVAHGIGGCRGREFTSNSLPLVQDLVNSGTSVLMIDLRGHGESGAARMTYGARERRDVLGAVDWLRNQGFAPGRIGVLGASMGGVAGVGAAAEDAAIGAIVIDSSCASFPAMMRTHFQSFTKLPRFFLPGTLAVARLLTGENLAQLRPERTLNTLTDRPVLIIHAIGDKIVPTEHARANAQAANAELWVTESPRHLGSYGKYPERYAEIITAFFERTLGVKRSVFTTEARRARRATEARK